MSINRVKIVILEILNLISKYALYANILVDKNCTVIGSN